MIRENKREIESDSEDCISDYEGKSIKFNSSNPSQNTLSCSLTYDCLNLTFQSTYEYESHYESVHRYKCQECSRSLPSSHYLHLHLLEIHDSFFSVLSQRGNVYECFIETCKKKCKNAFSRKRHLIDVHEFPIDYPFSVVLGIDYCEKKKYKRKSKRKNKSKGIKERNEIPESNEIQESNESDGIKERNDLDPIDFKMELDQIELIPIFKKHSIKNNVWSFEKTKLKSIQTMPK